MIKESEISGHIGSLTNGIKNLENSGYKNEIRLALMYKARADVYLNSYLNKYSNNNYIDSNLSINYYKDYRKAIEILINISSNRDAFKKLGEVRMAYGNAIKEEYLPDSNGSFRDKEKNAIKQYNKSVDIFLKTNDLKGYHFIMLEQMNLWVRKKTWEKGKLPKRVIFLHSLKSSESHILLQGLCYFAYSTECEVWEYHYGSVPSLDEEKNYIKDRLNESGGVVIIASPDYDISREIINFEIDQIIKMKIGNDPIAVFVIDLGNNDAVDRVKNYGKVISLSKLCPKQIYKKFTRFINSDVKDIYECRKQRL